MVGTTASARVVIPPTGDASVDGLIDAAHAALTGTRAVEPIYVGGVARMAEAFDAVETVRSVLRTLEEQYVVVSLVRDILDRGLERGDRIESSGSSSSPPAPSSWLRTRSTASPRVRSASSARPA